MMVSMEPRRLLVLLSTLLVVGCAAGSSAVSYYSLSSLYGEQKAAEMSGPTIGIGAILLPDYLDRPQIVTRTSPNQMRIEEYHRWAGQLADEISRVLLENLTVLTGSRRIARLPWSAGFIPDIVINTEVTTFEAFADGKVRLLAAVTLTEQRSTVKAQTLSIDLEEQAGGRGYSDLVAAQSRILATLSRRIAAAIAQRR